MLYSLADEVGTFDSLVRKWHFTSQRFSGRIHRRKHHTVVHVNFTNGVKESLVQSLIYTWDLSLFKVIFHLVSSVHPGNPAIPFQLSIIQMAGPPWRVVGGCKYKTLCSFSSLGTLVTGATNQMHQSERSHGEGRVYSQTASPKQYFAHWGLA